MRWFKQFFPASGETEHKRHLNRGEIQETWKVYATTDWFARIETECDRTMNAFFKDRA